MSYHRNNRAQSLAEVTRTIPKGIQLASHAEVAHVFCLYAKREYPGLKCQVHAGNRLPNDLITDPHGAVGFDPQTTTIHYLGRRIASHDLELVALCAQAVVKRPGLCALEEPRVSSPVTRTVSGPAAAPLAATGHAYAQA